MTDRPADGTRVRTVFLGSGAFGVPALRALAVHPAVRIVGIVTPGKGIAIHTTDCETLESFLQSPERWVEVSWDLGAGADAELHVGRIQLTVANERGSLGNLASVVGRNLGNINNLKITNRTPQFFDMQIDVEVRDVQHLNDIIAALRGIPAVNSVERAWSN